MPLQQTVFVVNGDEFTRKEICGFLSPAGIFDRSFDCAEKFINALDANPRGCVFLDAAVPPMGGLKLQEFLQTRDFDLPIIMIGEKGDVSTAVRAIRSGAFDYLEKPLDCESVLDSAIRALSRDNEYSQQRLRRNEFLSRLASLTKREHDVYEQLILGERVEKIALHLGLSPKTVYIHRDRVLHKMEVDSIPELIHVVAAHAINGNKSAAIAAP